MGMDFQLSPRPHRVAGLFPLFINSPVFRKTITRRVRNSSVSQTWLVFMVFSIKKSGLSTQGWGELCESYAENDIGKSEYRVVCEVVLESRLPCLAHKGRAKGWRLAAVKE
ncbi:hypothetical protein KY284_016318 [Solanum tuberosum]|nr:hypothetical protein KY284_016318 [Solanum tuberosum]